MLFHHVQTKDFKNLLNHKISHRAGRRVFDTVCMSVCVHFHLCLSFASVCVYLALATHSMIASFLPMVTLVFLGGMMMDGAMGSAGPPTSNTHRNAQIEKRQIIYNLHEGLTLSLWICLMQPIEHD